MIDPMIPYLAGFFDGEGSITDGSNGTWPSMRCIVTQIDPRPLRMLQDRYGGSLRLHNATKYNPRARRTWHWTIRAKKAAVFLRELLPFLVLKKDEAVAALVYQDSLSTGRHGHQLTTDEAKIRQITLDKWRSVRYTARTFQSSAGDINI